MPASSAVAAPQSASGVTPENILSDKKVSHPIISSCGEHVHIIVLGIVGCRFHEYGYGDGQFTIHNDTNGVIVIYPSSGNNKTTFSILGAVKGSGDFVVASKNQSLEVHVHVGL